MVDACVRVEAESPLQIRGKKSVERNGWVIECSAMLSKELSCRLPELQPDEASCRAADRRVQVSPQPASTPSDTPHRNLGNDTSCVRAVRECGGACDGICAGKACGEYKRESGSTRTGGVGGEAG